MTSIWLRTGLLVTAVLAGGVQTAQAEVNIYSARTEALIKPLLDQFSARTGIKVNLVSGGDDELISRLRIEGSKSQADLLITADAGRLHRAKELNLLRELHSERIDAAVPANLRDVDGTWIGLTMRARPIFYRKSAVDPTNCRLTRP